MRGLSILLLFLFPALSAAQESCGAPHEAQAGACGGAAITSPFLSVPRAETAPEPPPLQALNRPSGVKPAKPVLRNGAQDKSLHCAPAAQPGAYLLELFYAYDCPHCHKAIEWVEKVAAGYPGLRFLKYEIMRDPNARGLLGERLAAHGAAMQGVPIFFIGGKAIVGFIEGQTDMELEGEFKRLAGQDCSCRRKNEINIPFLGPVDPSSVSLLQFSAVLGLLDGFNPCAMWVLIFLMGLLVHTRSTKKMVLIGGVFIAVSGLIYFAFMAAWLNIFLVIGYARWITIGLGFMAVAMGLINLKELFFFKKGVSLMISDSAKPRIAERIRRIMSADKPAVMVAGTALLAVFVNLIELACTIGLPAIFTRVLSLKQASVWEKYYYMAVYNLAYVVPLAVILTLFVLTMGKYKMTETHGKILKAISGILMLLLGTLMIFKPEVLTL